MIKQELINFTENINIINTHCHHLDDSSFKDFNLADLLSNTYLSWSGASFDLTKESKQTYLDKVKYQSYFRWLQKGLKELYKIKEDLSVKTWELYSNAVSDHYSDKNWHKKILKYNCRYEKIILDAYWNPGDNNGDSLLFFPTFRINPLFFGYSRDSFDHNSNNIYKLYGKQFTDIDEYIYFVKSLIKNKVDNGCVAIKNALAYDRGLDFEEASKENAENVFKKRDNATKEDIKKFQDYLFDEICKIAAEMDIPVQCHTGMGLLEKTNALNMLGVIKNNPDTKFVLFHGSFPWNDDIIGMLHFLPNVYIDICWLPILSPTNAEYTLNQLIEIGTSEKICWGCDTWISEDSYGARLALIDTLTNVLSQKVEHKYFSIEDAKCVCENIFYKNSKSLYKI